MVTTPTSGHRVADSAKTLETNKFDLEQEAPSASGRRDDVDHDDADEEQQAKDKQYSFVAKCVVTVFSFLTSILLLNVTKLTFEDGFRYPLFLTSTHMMFSYVLSGMALKLGIVPKSEQKFLTFQQQLWVVGPFSFFGAASIASSNIALLYIYPSLHEMLQNLGPIWTVFCTRLLTRTTYNAWTYISIVPLVLGSMLCTAGELSGFVVAGFSFSNLAAIFRALRLLVQERVFSADNVVVQQKGRGSKKLGTEFQVKIDSIEENEDERLLHERALQDTKKKSERNFDPETLTIAGKPRLELDDIRQFETDPIDHSPNAGRSTSPSVLKFLSSFFKLIYSCGRTPRTPRSPSGGGVASSRSSIRGTTRSARSRSSDRDHSRSGVDYQPDSTHECGIAQLPFFRYFFPSAESMRARGYSDFDGRIDPISLLYYSSPINCILFIVASLLREGLLPWHIVFHYLFYHLSPIFMIAATDDDSMIINDHWETVMLNYRQKDKMGYFGHPHQIKYAKQARPPAANSGKRNEPRVEATNKDDIERRETETITPQRETEKYESEKYDTTGVQSTLSESSQAAANIGIMHEGLGTKLPSESRIQTGTSSASSSSSVGRGLSSNSSSSRSSELGRRLDDEDTVAFAAARDAPFSELSQTTRTPRSKNRPNRQSADPYLSKYLRDGPESLNRRGDARNGISNSGNPGISPNLMAYRNSNNPNNPKHSILNWHPSIFDRLGVDKMARKKAQRRWEKQQKKARQKKNLSVSDMTPRFAGVLSQREPSG